MSASENISKGEIVLYQPDDTVAVEVRLEDETVWLTQAQIEELFAVDQSGVSRHIRNIFKDGEVDEKSNMQKLHIPNSDKPVAFYSLDVILSVGYRANSGRAIDFRKWASRVLKDYVIKGYAVNQRIDRLERKVVEHDQKFDLLIKTSVPPKEGVFFDGQIFDAYVFATDLIKSAKKSIVLIDNYIDETVLLMLSKRKAKVRAKIYTRSIGAKLQLDITKHCSQYEPIDVDETKNCHDRFLIIDDTVYFIGASLKDLGKKLFAFSKMGIKPAELLKGII